MDSRERVTVENDRGLEFLVLAGSFVSVTKRDADQDRPPARRSRGGLLCKGAIAALTLFDDGAKRLTGGQTPPSPPATEDAVTQLIEGPWP